MARRDYYAAPRELTGMLSFAGIGEHYPEAYGDGGWQDGDAGKEFPADFRDYASDALIYTEGQALRFVRDQDEYGEPPTGAELRKFFNRIGNGEYVLKRQRWAIGRRSYRQKIATVLCLEIGHP